MADPATALNVAAVTACRADGGPAGAVELSQAIQIEAARRAARRKLLLSCNIR
jgi:hypothetical protein